MANLMIKRADPEAAKAELIASIHETLPNAGVQTRSIGDVEQRSLFGALGHELGGYFRAHEPGIFSVTADCSSPRPLRIHCQYVAVGRGAGPSSILYLTRLRHVIPGPVAFKRGTFRSGQFEGEPGVAERLSGIDGIGSAVWRLLQPLVVYGTAVLTIESFAELFPDDDGALFGVVSAPARKTFGLGGYRLDLAAFLEIASTIESALASAPGVVPAATINVALPAGPDAA